MLASIATVNGAPVEVQRRLVHGLGQRRMGVDDARQVFTGALEFHRHHALRDQFGSVGAEDVHAENRVAFGVGTTDMAIVT